MKRNTKANIQAQFHVTGWIIEPSGKRRLAFKRRHNTAGADLIGQICYMMANSATSKPANYMGFLYFAVALIPAITTIVAIDAKAAKKKRFWFF